MLFMFYLIFIYNSSFAYIIVAYKIKFKLLIYISTIDVALKNLM